MQVRYLPSDKNEVFSPLDVQKLLNRAINDQGGDAAAALKSGKNKKIVELWYASYLAQALYIQTNDKYFLLDDENPDVHFVKDVGEKIPSGFSVEVLSLTGVEGLNEEQIAKWAWEKKGLTNYGDTSLLIASRRAGFLNLDVLASHLVTYEWKFTRIWLSVFDGQKNEWKICLVVPSSSDPKGLCIEIENGALTY